MQRHWGQKTISFGTGWVRNPLQADVHWQAEAHQEIEKIVKTIMTSTPTFCFY